MTIILVVPDGFSAWKAAFEAQNQTVTLVPSGSDALDFISLYEFDAAVVVSSPNGFNGLEVVRSLRKRANSLAIILIAKDHSMNVVGALDAGADDFLAPPISFDELLARLRAAVRRQPTSRVPSLQVGDLVVEPASRTVSRGGIAIHLSNTEYRIVEFLLRRRGKIVSRRAIMEGVWGPTSAVAENTLDAFMHLVREKLDARSPRKLICTVRGVGYRIPIED